VAILLLPSPVPAELGQCYGTGMTTIGKGTTEASVKKAKADLASVNDQIRQVITNLLGLTRGFADDEDRKVINAMLMELNKARGILQGLADDPNTNNPG